MRNGQNRVVQKPNRNETLLSEVRQQPGSVSHSRQLEITAMKCLELQSDLTLYADGLLSEDEQILVKAHMEICPLCRQKYAEYREITTGLRHMPRPPISLSLQRQIKRSVRSEIRNSKKSWLPVTAQTRQWFNTSVMPYAVGVLASLVIGFTFLAMMFSGIRDAGQFTAQNAYHPDSVMLASNSNPFRDESSDTLSPTDYARTRLDISRESPSINPQGALIALTRSFVRGGMKDDEVVVVADVFGNGLAQIAEVVEPSRDSQAIGELQKALGSDPAFTPFVPSTMETRPETVRVVLKFQSVNVSTGLKSNKHRL